MIHCFYHSADLDGHCSGAIVKYRYPEVVMHPINYGDAFPWDEIQSDDTVYMVDFCLQPEEQMHNLNAGCKLIWIDHHKSAICAVDTTEVIMSGKRDISKAACELTWEYLFPDKPMPLAVYLLGRYDIWDHSDDRVLPFQMRMRMEHLDPKIDEGMDSWHGLFTANQLIRKEDGREIWGYTIIALLDQGYFILQYDEEQKRKYVQTYGFETDLDIPGRLLGPEWPIVTKLSCIAVNLGHTNSKVFDSVWDETKYDLMITFCRRSDRKWNVSLYSTNPDIDCGAIAKSFGGGGHKGAAGFQCDELPFEY